MESALNQFDLYTSPPNKALFERTKSFKFNHILDVGAGTGGNLKYLKKLHPYASTTAITCSKAEAQELRHIADKLIVCNLNAIFDDKSDGLHNFPFDNYDLIILSHVLEHVQSPSIVTEFMSHLLLPEGIMLIAVPNICHWRSRLQVALGNFQYEDSGVFDQSHLRFFTYWTAQDTLKDCKRLRILDQWPVGGAILGPIRRWLPKSVCKWIDNKAILYMPNLFGYEAHILAQKSK